MGNDEDIKQGMKDKYWASLPSSCRNMHQCFLRQARLSSSNDCQRCWHIKDGEHKTRTNHINAYCFHPSWKIAPSELGLAAPPIHIRHSPSIFKYHMVIINRRLPLQSADQAAEMLETYSYVVLKQNRRMLTQWLHDGHVIIMNEIRWPFVLCFFFALLISKWGEEDEWTVPYVKTQHFILNLHIVPDWPRISVGPDSSFNISVLASVINFKFYKFVCVPLFTF